VPQKDASTCGYPTQHRSGGLAAAINAFITWETPVDFAVKHCNPSQLFGQQVFRNPAFMIESPGSVMNSLLGPVQMDTSLYISNTNSFVGTYEAPVAKAIGSPKVSSITGAVSLQAIAVVNNQTLKIMLSKEIQAVEKAFDDNSPKYEQLLEEMWLKLEKLVIDLLL